ncbi:Mss4-like protein [Xylariales sp. PMI_506]|nr:Mss4-like protein [Xylariales sp. PMI_506]
MAAADRTGSCLCEKVTVKITGEPIQKVLCHCHSCQKSSGVIFESNFFLGKEQVEITDTDKVIREYKDSSCDNGGTVHRAFCSNCGSNVYITNPTNPAIIPFIIVPMGILDEKEDTKPANEFYVKRRAEWFGGVDGSTEFQSMF